MSFIRELLRDKNVAAVAASSSHVVRRVVDAVAPLRPRCIVELGPGEGAATAGILNWSPRIERYVAIERNPSFAARLEAWNDTRLELIRGDAVAEMSRLAELAPDSIDAVVASIPFTYLSRLARERVIADAMTALRPGGVLCVFHQYSPLMAPYIKKTFGTCRIAFEPRNMFPCFVMTAAKP